jgi:hypothetical protein
MKLLVLVPKETFLILVSEWQVLGPRAGVEKLLALVQEEWSEWVAKTSLNSNSRVRHESSSLRSHSVSLVTE